MSETLTVVAAVIVDDGAVLACRRRPGKADAGRWEFPGGKVEPGESPEEALRREIREELGVGIRILGEPSWDETRVGERTIRLGCFRSELEGPRPRRSTDHDRLEWVAPGELGALEWSAPDLPAVRILIAEG